MIGTQNRNGQSAYAGPDAACIYGVCQNLRVGGTAQKMGPVVIPVRFHSGTGDDLMQILVRTRNHRIIFDSQ